MTEFTGTYNNVRQKQAASHLPCAFTAEGVVTFRRWFVRAHPMTTEPGVSGKRTHERGYRNSPNNPIVVIEGMMHTKAFLL